MARKKYYPYKCYRAFRIFCLIALVSSLVFLFPQRSQSSESEKEPRPCWEELTADAQYSISQSFRFYRFTTDNGSLATLVVLDLKDHSFIIRPFFNQQTKTVSAVVKEQKAIAGINGGFFNLSNGESTSYVVVDGKNQCDPKTNKALINNPELAPYLETIFNRSEFRIMEDNSGKLKACITAHSTPVPAGWTLVHSLQAGPRLLPTVADTQEAFVRKSSDNKSFDSIGSNKKASRTAVGITRDNHVLFLTVANKKQDEFSSGITLDQLAKMLKELGCNQALNCDGGTSTTMVIAQGDTRDELDYVIHKVISGDPEKQVKSGLIIQKNITRIKSRYSNNSFPH